jgi:hypothetical protein
VTPFKVKASYGLLPPREFAGAAARLTDDRLRLMISVLGRNHRVDISWAAWDSVVAAVEAERNRREP